MKYLSTNEKEILRAFKHCTNSHGSCNDCMYCFTKYGELRCDAKKRNIDIIKIIYNLQNEIESICKETAKEIYKRIIELSEDPCNGREEIYKTVFEKYGVEVEE